MEQPKIEMMPEQNTEPGLYSAHTLRKKRFEFYCFVLSSFLVFCYSCISGGVGLAMLLDAPRFIDKTELEQFSIICLLFPGGCLFFFFTFCALYKSL